MLLLHKSDEPHQTKPVFIQKPVASARICVK